MDLAVLEALAVGRPIGRDEPSPLEKIKKIFTNAVKSGIYGDPNSRLSLALKLPHFIVVVGICEVFMHVYATKDLTDALIYHPKKKCEIWRFLTYMLLHHDGIHLTLNIIIQTILAAPLEFEQGHIRTAILYIGGGLAGSLGGSLFDHESLLVGASGGIYALLMSQVSHVLLNYTTLKYVVYRLFAVGVLALADLAHIWYHIYAFQNESPRIGLAAHFAGALSGLLLGSMFFKGTVKWKNYIHVISAVLVIVLLTTAVVNLMLDSKCNIS